MSSFALLSPSHAIVQREKESDAGLMSDTEDSMPDTEPYMPDTEPANEHIALCFGKNIQMLVKTDAVVNIFPETANLSPEKQQLLDESEEVTITIGDGTHKVHFVVKRAVIDPQSCLDNLINSPGCHDEGHVHLKECDPRLYPLALTQTNNLFTGNVSYIHTQSEADADELRTICDFLLIAQIPIPRANDDFQKFVQHLLAITDEDVDRARQPLMNKVYQAFHRKAVEHSNEEYTRMTNRGFYTLLKSHGARSIAHGKHRYFANVQLVVADY